MDYEIVKFIITYGKEKEQKEAYTEENAVSLYEQHKDENACVYQIRKMIF